MMRFFIAERLLGIMGVSVALGFACGPEPTPDFEVVRGAPGAALPGLTNVEAARFERGKELFDRPFSPEEGLRTTVQPRSV